MFLFIFKIQQPTKDDRACQYIICCFGVDIKRHSDFASSSRASPPQPSVVLVFVYVWKGNPELAAVGPKRILRPAGAQHLYKTHIIYSRFLFQLFVFEMSEPRVRKCIVHYVYIYIYRERERYTYIYIYITCLFMCLYTQMYMYMYIFCHKNTYVGHAVTHQLCFRRI